MAGLVCGIDIGSTNLKVVIVDEAGRAVHSRAVPTPRRPDGAGVATDAAELVALLEAMVIQGWREAGAGRPLLAIASAGVGEDGIGVGPDLAPTGFALPWFDARAAAEAGRLRRSPAATARAGIAIAADRTAAKWSWLRRHRPGDLADARYWIALTDFPSVWWSGRPFMSATLAPRTACYDVYGRQWIEPLLAAAGAPPLPPLLEAGAIVAGVRKGPLRDSGAASAETLIIAGGHDHPIAAGTIRRLAPTARVDSMGTANLVYGEAPVPTLPRLDPFLALSLPPSGAPGVACLGVMELSAALEPARRDPALFREVLAARRLPGHPPESMADGAPDAVVAVRRALERASLLARRLLAALDEAGAPAGPIHATGGWARSTGFLELRASIFGCPIHAVEEPELTALGAAFLAATAATGVAPRLEDTRRVRIVEPVAAWCAPYDRLFPAIRRELDAAVLRSDMPGFPSPEPAQRSARGHH
ncbi:FGGY family carbohydrate kinase [Labrys wisconsinensis]|uniref:Xylulokinase n=1 Tax=Labrys wisconsinensis TaxID=425677 RepID=A0ABU0JE86_9HYPH|nr:FGGY family carbohydrate kinase [Labrys wisconsinensis]MDQ0472583.1 xylulokinase [Labrys wisconsinensis]